MAEELVCGVKLAVVGALSPAPIAIISSTS